MLPWLENHCEFLAGRGLNGTLHHGLLIKGEQGLGIEQLSGELAQRLLCQSPSVAGACMQCQSCRLFASASHPDFTECMSEKQLGVDAIRQAIEKLTATSHVSSNKVLVIYDAHTMTEAAANALLKTLEEPTPNTYIMLLSNSSGSLLPTIVSRCETVAVAPPSVEVCQQWLASKGFNDVAESYVRAYRCAPLLIGQSLNGEDGKTFDEFTVTLSELISNTVTPSQAAQNWEAQATQCVIWFTFILVENMQRGRISANSFSDYDTCLSLQRTLEQTGVNKSLILTTLFHLVLSVNNKTTGAENIVS